MITTKLNNFIRIVFVPILWLFVMQAFSGNIDPIKACISPALQAKLTRDNLSSGLFLEYLKWKGNQSASSCGGAFEHLPSVETLPVDDMKLQANLLDLNEYGCSKLDGDVSFQYNQQLLEANTAYVYRNKNTGKITRIELVKNISMREPGKKIVADYGKYYPEKEVGYVWNAAYRIDLNRAHSILPGWGKASFIKRASSGIIYLKDASFSTCSPQSIAWSITAKKLELNPKTERGVAKHSFIKFYNKPLFYFPYLSFPITAKRQSGFLMPTMGFTNISGYDFTLPYYWNMAPNMDATIIPHVYSMRGLMMGGEFRYLDRYSNGMLMGQILPNDQLFGKFLNSNSSSYPQLNKLSKNRWSGIWRDQTFFTPNFGLKVDYQKVSDDYYLQDFSSNLAVMTENQLLRQGEVNYQNDHWLLKAMLQNYQTLQPINQSFVTHLYARQPQFIAQGHFDHVIGNSTLDLIGQFDQFEWTGGMMVPQGPRLHLNPVLSVPYRRNYGYLNPKFEMIGNFYQLSNVNPSGVKNYSVGIPRYSLDTGLFFDKYMNMGAHEWQQTLEPRLYYLYVPYQNQTVVPSFESAYMIFNTDQLYRPNRFSGFDRIGDTNQLSYGFSSKLINPNTGQEKLNFLVGSIRYFKDRQLNLCYSVDSNGNCQDTPLYLGYLSPISKQSPVASRLVYSLWQNWSVISGYAYDVNTNSSNNGDVSIHFQPDSERVIHLGYSYLVNGNVISGLQAPLDDTSLNQATAAYAWPFNEKWGSLAAYSYNISNGYAMMMLGGVQYDSCCWALRLLGGRTFQSLAPQTLQPQYNNNIYFQILLKGLGSASNSDPSSILQTYLPGLYNVFNH